VPTQAAINQCLARTENEECLIIVLSPEDPASLLLCLYRRALFRQPDSITIKFHRPLDENCMSLQVAEFDAIESLTQQSDYGGLCDCFLASLHSLSGVRAKLIEVYDDRGYANWQASDVDHFMVREYPTLEKCPQPEWLAAAVELSANNGAATVVSSTTGYLIGFGAVSGLCRFVEIASIDDCAVKNSIYRIAKIFAHLMRIIDKFEHDPLTGLLNRQSFDYRFEDLIEYHQKNPNRIKTDTNPWLAIADIDHFKRVNDTYGHLFGDEILLLVSRIMRQAFRFDDLFFRYGGEEFIIILNNTDAISAELALERFRSAIQNYVFPRLGEMTVSIGWTGIGQQEFSTDVIHRADNALYFAKENGRNRVASDRHSP
jgi:diguanylate cyclase